MYMSKINKCSLFPNAKTYSISTYVRIYAPFFPFAVMMWPLTTSYMSMSLSTGPNKAVFLIYNYPLSRLSTTGSEQIIDPSLSSRLQSQEALKHYLDNGQVLSWTTTPSQTHLHTLHDLTQLDPNPVPYSYTESCGIL